jgi:hypothetical protein
MRVGPLYHGVFADLYIKFSPFHPEMGIKGMASGLYPTFFKNSDIYLLISRYLSSE